MSDEALPVTESDDEIAQGDEQKNTDKTKKRGLFRWWGLGLILGTILVTVLGAEFGFSYTVRSAISGALTNQNLSMDEASELSASLLGGSVAIENLTVSDQSSEEPSTPYQSDELQVDVATMDTLFGSDYVIDRLASQGTRFDFRRRSDGSIPGMPAVKPGTPEGEAEQTDEADEAQDLVSLFEQVKERWEQAQEYGWFWIIFPAVLVRAKAKPPSNGKMPPTTRHQSRKAMPQLQPRGFLFAN